MCGSKSSELEFDGRKDCVRARGAFGKMLLSPELFLLLVLLTCNVCCSLSPVFSRKSLAMARRAPQPLALADFEPPGNPPPEIWVGSIVAVIPIIWASFAFADRIQTQQACLVCKGSGLVYATKAGTELKRARKCYNCGGFLPWLGWKYFWLSNFAPGNGGALRQPSPDYEKNNQRVRENGIADEDSFE